MGDEMTYLSMDRRKLIQSSTVLCLLFLLSSSHVMSQSSSSQSDSSLHFIDKNLAYFNTSQDSYLRVQSALSLRDMLSFSFRSCSHGSLIQAGDDGDFLRIDLTPEGHLEVAWQDQEVTNDEVSLREHTMTVGDPSTPLNTNTWYTIDVRFNLGDILFTIEQGSKLVHRILMSNGTFHEYLRNLDLAKTGFVKIGRDFTGCISGGPNLMLDKAGVALFPEDTDTISIGSCPLDKIVGCGKDDPCWTYPCQNNGRCQQNSTLLAGYKCHCSPPYTGENCQIDQGHLGCEIAPCMNDAECIDVENGTRRYHCKCKLGFVGINCEINKDECLSRPCQNGGICFDDINSYTCNCTDTGFTGRQCEVNIDECYQNNPCEGGATCIDTPGGYKCQCPFGFGGKHCEIAINECLSNPCLNGGKCVDLLSAYLCVCSPGFTGVQCEQDIDDCSQSNCSDPNAVCVDDVNSYSCVCLEGYALSEENICVRPNKCDPDPCLNGATCLDEDGDFQCLCLPGYSGSLCEDFKKMDLECAGGGCQNGGRCKNCERHIRSVNDCDLNPCKNGATCRPAEPTGYICHCTSSFMGKNCTQQYNACAFKPCENGGNCSTTPPDRYRVCTCPLGFTGDNCEVNIDDCRGVQCSPPKICVDKVNNYTCECPSGFEGPTCSITNTCATKPCQNNGTCYVQNGTFSCQCSGTWVNHTLYTGDSSRVYWVGYQGDRCERQVEACDMSPNICLNGGICRPDNRTEYGFNCYCPSGSGDYFTGKYCRDRMPYCTILNQREPPVCYNGGRCEDISKDEVRCICEPGFTGTHCEINIDDCQTNPCRNNATCIDGVNKFICACPDGFTDVNCSTNINECASNPCQHGGVCTDALAGFVCDCTGTGYNGSRCDIWINPCLSQPCKHHSTCKSTGTSTTYTCDCYPGYTGVHCETDIDECLSVPCQNNGTCLENSDESRAGYDVRYAQGFTCRCLTGFTGNQCEVNINECEGHSCVHGHCLDMINDYVCACDDGYRGRDCDIEVDECAVFSPCQHGARCVDKIADYDCSCVMENNTVYGGKNCSVPLIGCTTNLCQNSASCVPILARETPSIQHSYKCNCPPGYTGPQCQSNTTASFFGDSWLKYGGTNGTSDMYLTFRIQTTLLNGILVINGAPGASEYFLIQLVNGTKIVMDYSNLLDVFSLYVEPQKGFKIADGSWYTVNVTIQYTGILLELVHPGCPGGKCQKNTPFTTPSGTPTIKHHVLGQTWFGGSELTFIPANGLQWFTGCMQDIKVNQMSIVPADYVNNSTLSLNVQNGCARVDQCGVDPCNSHGNCTDLWFDYSCSCWRPYLGDDCGEEYTPATFGHEEKTSSATFNPPNKDDLVFHNDISLFLRTRKESGLVFYLGNTGGSNYIAMDIFEGKLRVRVRIQTGSSENMCYGSNQYISDGTQYYVRLIRVIKEIRYWIQPTGNGDPTIVYDSTALRCNVSVNIMFTPEVFYVGGFPARPTTRNKRDINTSDIFEGTIQGIEQNGWMGQFFPLNNTNGTGQLPSYPLPTMVEVLPGEVSDNMCMIHMPCQNDANCTNVFFNDYMCTCVEGFRGKNCSELDFCVSSQCPSNATCLNLEDGYECVSAATFDGLTSFLQYSHTVNVSTDIYTLLVEFRTRQPNAVLLHIRGGAVLPRNFLTLELIKGQVTLTFDLGISGDVSIQVNVTDGEWHNMTVDIESGGFYMELDGMHSEGVNLTNSVNLFQLIQNSNNIYVGGVSSNYYSAERAKFQTDDYTFKGCIEEVRIGNLLLPFFNETELLNNTSVEKFAVADLMNIEIGCSGDPVCDTNACENNSSCEDIWNDYMCNCLPGYTGQYCEINIDECQGNMCKYNATCVDGIANYTCTCLPGYTGYLCDVEINECESDPCQNNGTCIDRLAAYDCNCTANYTGNNCQINIWENCDMNPDLCNNGTCMNVNITGGVTTFNCTCDPGITGRYCEDEVNYCEGDPCVNNATCHSSIKLLNYTCHCAPGYNGRDCEVDINECASNPCKNGGNCKDFVARFECVCLKGWAGATCELDINECNMTINGTDPCENGVCVNLNGSYMCNCTDSGYNGERCENDIDECLSNTTCLNGASCNNTDGDFDCNCTLGYKGRHCEDPDCNVGNCFNNGNCSINDKHQWYCACPKYIEGFRCESPGPCVSGPCVNNATCSQSGDQFNCSCASGWKGITCALDIDECTEVAPCQNNATCQNLDGTYNCVCWPGYTDFNCSTEINECESNPCQNGGKCVNLVNKFECDCIKTGYEGDMCETDINECLNDVCDNDGNCTNLDGDFNCTCPTDFVGKTCHTNNPCTDQYCLNDGTCDYIIDEDALNATAFCKCNDPWYGPQCEFTTDPGVNVPLVVGLTVGLVLAAIIVVMIVLLVVFKEKRATRGTYSPSRQETVGSRVELGNVLKQPPMERLI